MPPGGLLAHTVDSERLPPWLSEADVDAYAADFAESGFAGDPNWYRNLDRNWELTGPWHGAQVTTPALFLAGDRDLVLAFSGFSEVIAGLQAFVPNLRHALILPGRGRWTQQERSTEVKERPCWTSYAASEQATLSAC